MKHATEKPLVDPAPEAVEPEEDPSYVRTFTLPTGSFYGTDEELDTYGAHVKREAEALGLRPTDVTAGKPSTDRAAGTITIVFTAR